MIVYIISFTVNLGNLVGILQFQHNSIQIGHISRVPWPHGTGGYPMKHYRFIALKATFAKILLLKTGRTF